MPNGTTDASGEIKAKIAALVRKEVEAWEDPVAYVTPKVAFRTRKLIETLRKNYYGIFDEPNDPTTGRAKTWMPLTESVVDNVVKNIDLDTKDVDFMAKNSRAIPKTAFVRSLVRAKLDAMAFGDKLDELERYLCVDGTAIWKTYVTTNRDGKKQVKVKLVDPLNFLIDPTAPSVQEATAVIERAALTLDEVRGMDGWKDTDDLEPRNVSRNSPDMETEAVDGGSELVEVYERWGLMPLQFITGREEDADELVEGHIVVSDPKGSVRIHLVEENGNEDSLGNPVKPYEEVRYTRVPGRWAGRGPAEKLMVLQAYLNTIVNIRILRSIVTQLGLFKVKKGSGVTPQMLSRLPVNGAITVNDQSDIEQMVVQEASQASYTDESNISDWAQRVTSAYESVTGEQLPSSTPATNAVIQNRMAQSQFVMVKEGIGLFLQRWLDRHFIPKLASVVDKDEIVRVTGETRELESMDRRLANALTVEAVRKSVEAGVVPTPSQAARARDAAMAKIRESGPDRFVKAMELPDMTEYDVRVVVTNEEVDKGVLAQNLIGILGTVASSPGIGIDPSAIVRQIFDVMGLDSQDFAQKPSSVPAQVAPMLAAPQARDMTGKEAATAQQLTTQANTM